MNEQQVITSKRTRSCSLLTDFGVFVESAFLFIKWGFLTENCSRSLVKSKSGGALHDDGARTGYINSSESVVHSWRTEIKRREKKFVNNLA